MHAIKHELGAEPDTAPGVELPKRRLRRGLYGEARVRFAFQTGIESSIIDIYAALGAKGCRHPTVTVQKSWAPNAPTLSQPLSMLDKQTRPNRDSIRRRCVVLYEQSWSRKGRLPVSLIMFYYICADPVYSVRVVDALR